MGRGNKLQSKADQIRAIVRLVKNETIYILVGQQGSAFCQINGVRIFVLLLYRGCTPVCSRR